MGNCNHQGDDPKACSTCGVTQEQQQSAEDQAISRTLTQIRHKILVMSGKGGVGKSSVAVSLALSLARRGHKVGLMDVDMHGPNVLRMLGLKEAFDLTSGQFQLPPEIFHNFKVISIEAVMRDREIAVIWRGPLKHQLIRQFLTEVQWGFLDYLIIDAPPGTGDEPMSVAQTIPEAKAVIVTTPQEISLADVRKSINFCQKINLDILGLVENMSGYRCLHCGGELPLFKKGGGEKTAQVYNIPFLGALPFDPQVVEAADEGRLIDLKEEGCPFFEALRPLVNYLVKVLPPLPVREPGVLRFALPLENGRVAAQPTKAPELALFTVKEGSITHREVVPQPDLDPVNFPVWLENLGITHLAGNLGDAAQALLKRKGIEVFTVAPDQTPEQAVAEYVK
jgi:Mrp family chromosome partitioning ATPase/predicted Fe-Mo cluster-binding NifX family protein